MEKIRTYVIARLQEPSTWRGLVLVATAFGVALSTEQQEAIVAVGLLVAGMIGATTSGWASRARACKCANATRVVCRVVAHLGGGLDVRLHGGFCQHMLQHRPRFDCRQ